jgi:hypothetical protein
MSLLGDYLSKSAESAAIFGGVTGTFIRAEGTTRSFDCIAGKTPHRLPQAVEKSTTRGRLGQGYRVLLPVRPVEPDPAAEEPRSFSASDTFPPRHSPYWGKGPQTHPGPWKWADVATSPAARSERDERNLTAHFP